MPKENEQTVPVWSLVHGAANACMGSTTNASGDDPKYWPISWRKQCLENCGGWSIIRFDDVPRGVANDVENDFFDTHEEYDKLLRESSGYEIVYEEGETISS